MTIRKIINILLFMLLFATVIYAEENSNEIVIETEVEAIETKEEIEVEEDLEVLDRIRLYEMRFKGTREISEELMTSIKAGLASHNMPIDIVVNEKYLETDVDALVIDNRTYVPLRAIVEAFNFTDVTWNEDFYKATFKAGAKEVEFLINTPKVIVNGKELLMDTSSLIIDNRTMVPIRFISEFLGFNVKWDSVYYVVTLTHESYVVNEDKLDGRFYSVEELKTFSKLVYKEAGSVSYETKHGIASVVMNQVRNIYLENTINGVIFAESRSEHFPPAHKAGFQDTVPNKDSVLAVKKVLRGENSVGTCLYFNTSPFKGKTIFKVIDGVYFCY